MKKSTTPHLIQWRHVAEREAFSEDEHGSIFTRRKGMVRLADGTEHRALLDFCETDSNEHYGTLILIADPEGFVDEDDSFAIQEDGAKAFCKKLGKTLAQVFPYKYQYEGPECVDHHIGDDGWSR